MTLEKKIGGNQENTNLVDIVHVIDIIVVVGVIEIEIVTAAIAMILAARILTIEKGADEIEIESTAIDTMIKRGKEIEENAVVEAGAEVHLTKKKTEDMNVMTEMTAMNAKMAICEHTH